ncbi:universal stress protein [Marinoscillum pacificum]|uniref:universal stress protein n=1 Tax=Marinoscillum pacificum TaxID=392723 RepID=UPI0021572027|nr:universal stress protein [Marinoscillum pacificum]
MKTILVATDYSKAANNALKYAANLAAVLDARLVLFNAFKVSEHALNGLASSTSIDHMTDQKRQQLKELAERTSLKYHLEVEAVSHQGDIEELLKRQTEQSKPDLVVLGMESNILAYEWFGNTTTSMIKTLKVPIMVVPNEVPYENINRIVFAYDPKFVSESNDFLLLREITNQYNAKLEVFHVNTNQSEHVALSSVEEVFEDVSFIYHEIESSNVPASISSEVEKFGANMLVMVPHKVTFFESLTTGSTTRKFALKSKIPLLILPNS